MRKDNGSALAAMNRIDWSGPHWPYQISRRLINGLVEMIIVVRSIYLFSWLPSTPLIFAQFFNSSKVIFKVISRVIALWESLINCLASPCKCFLKASFTIWSEANYNTPRYLGNFLFRPHDRYSGQNLIMSCFPAFSEIRFMAQKDKSHLQYRADQ